MTNRKAFASGFCFSPQKMRVLELSHSDGNGNGNGSSTNNKDEEPLPQDADYSNLSLSDELEASILARFPRSQHWKLRFLNKRFSALVKSGEIYKIRRELGFKEPSVFMLASGESNWCSMEWPFMSSKKLPPIQSDYNFEYGDKESFCAGSQLLVSGKEIDGSVIWLFDSSKNEWLRGPSMISPRCLFASATRGAVAYVAGGLDARTYTEVLDSAERYDSERRRWEPLPRMNKRRRFCSGCFMDKKFYVLGGQDEHGKDLICGEYFDEKTNSWSLIHDIWKDVGMDVSNTNNNSSIPLFVSPSPPLLAVVNNELYTLDASSNEVKVYVKGGGGKDCSSSSWRSLGVVPVRADAQGGWGVAFKSLGDELLVIGAPCVSHTELALSMYMYTCCPHPCDERLRWRQIGCGSIQLNHFIRNCAVMMGT